MTLARSLVRPAFGMVLAAAAIAAVTLGSAPPARAQGGGIQLLRDTETERLLRSYQVPLLVAAGLQPEAVHLYLVNDPTINAFVAEGQNMFLNAGLLMELKTPNQVTGVMAHETGHMEHGDLVRTAAGVRTAMVPMLIAMAAGIVAMVAGAGEAGAAIMMAGQQIAEGKMLAFTRTQESGADQAGVRLLTATQQSGMGMLQVFQRFENDEILVSRKIDPFAQTHPASADRITALQALVDASPYRDKKDSAEAQYAFDMMQAKLRGYIQRPDVTLRQYPLTDTSRPARYARAMAYLHQPDLAKAQSEVSSLLAEEPENPYFLEMMGDIRVQLGKVQDAIEPYQHAVQILPDAPLIRVSLGAALLGTENPKYVPQAQENLETALKQENDNPLAWYELAEAYSRLGQGGKADLATAERYFAIDSFTQAAQFAARAQRQLQSGTIDWQRASDIMATAQSQIANNRRNGR